MNIRTKILTVAALLAVWSCAEKEITPTAPDGSKPIEFGSLSTRALVDGIEDVKEFGVSCAISNADNSDYGSIMDNVKVERSNKSDTGWDYNPKRYWLEDSYFYFVASYPYVDGGGFKATEGEIDGVNRIGFSLDVNMEDQVDILTASKYVHTSDSWETDVVKLQLGHLLTNINVRITQDASDAENNYYIKSISLYGISTSGTYGLLPDGNAITSYWTLGSLNNEDNAIVKNLDSTIPLKNRTISVWDTDGLLVLPQTINNRTAHIKIIYDYQLKQDEEDQPRKEKTIIIDIPGTNKWVSGNKLTYILSFANPNKIIFRNVSVKPWGDAQNGGTIIID
jgi:hypothetical protein